MNRKNLTTKSQSLIENFFIQKRCKTKKVMKTNSASKCLSLKAKIEGIEEQLKESYLGRRKKLENEAISKTKKNSKAFYAYAKKFSKTFTGVGPIIREDGKVITNPREIAEMQKE